MPDRLKALEQEVLDLKILNGGKDYVIEQMRKERDGFIQQVVQAHRKVGQLESKLKQIVAPQVRIAHVGDAMDLESEAFDDSEHFAFD